MAEAQLESLIERLRGALVLRSEVTEAYLFGSVATGKARAHSDVDVAVYVDDTALDRPGFGIGPELGAELSRVLGRNDVDVVVLNQAPPVLYREVLKDGIRILARDLSATTTREGQALSRYCDYVPQLEMIERAHRARLAAGGFGR